MLTSEQIVHYNEQGYLIVPDVFDSKTVDTMREHYMALRAEGEKPGDFGGTKDRLDDANHQYPRMIQMHKWDTLSDQWSSHPQILAAVKTLMNDEPMLNQTMLYFKPPQSRGQALHQDAQYITLDPLIGVWIPLDTSDQDVGQMVVGPGSHKYGLYHVEKADTNISFTNVQTLLPKNADIVGLDMNPGDVLFFHGRIIHGSYANVTQDRWRRTFICHYVGQHAQKFDPQQGTHVSHLN